MWRYRGKGRIAGTGLDADLLDPANRRADDAGGAEKGSAAAHYVMGGPTANRHNAFTLGTAATEIYVMHGETAAVATYAAAP